MVTNALFGMASCEKIRYESFSLIFFGTNFTKTPNLRHIIITFYQCLRYIPKKSQELGSLVPYSRFELYYCFLNNSFVLISLLIGLNNMKITFFYDFPNPVQIFNSFNRFWIRFSYQFEAYINLQNISLSVFSRFESSYTRFDSAS